MQGTTQKHRKAGGEQDHLRTVRRKTIFDLGKHLADRTQQRIVRRAAWDWCRLYEGRGVSGTRGKALPAKRCGSDCPPFRHLPWVRYSKRKLGKEGEQTHKHPQAAQRYASHL
jgi:hypothetical protein